MASSSVSWPSRSRASRQSNWAFERAWCFCSGVSVPVDRKASKDKGPRSVKGTETTSETSLPENLPTSLLRVAAAVTSARGTSGPSGPVCTHLAMLVPRFPELRRGPTDEAGPTDEPRRFSEP